MRTQKKDGVRRMRKVNHQVADDITRALEEQLKYEKDIKAIGVNRKQSIFSQKQSGHSVTRQTSFVRSGTMTCPFAGLGL